MEQSPVLDREHSTLPDNVDDVVDDVDVDDLPMILTIRQMSSSTASMMMTISYCCPMLATTMAMRMMRVLVELIVYNDLNNDRYRDGLPYSLDHDVMDSFVSTMES